MNSQELMELERMLRRVIREELTEPLIRASKEAQRTVNINNGGGLRVQSVENG